MPSSSPRALSRRGRDEIEAGLPFLLGGDIPIKALSFPETFCLRRV